MWRRRRSRRLQLGFIVPGVALVSLVLALPARADVTTTVNFDSYAAGTSVTEQYPGITFASPTAYGFSIGEPAADGVVPGGAACGPPIVVATSPNHSPPNAGNLGPTLGNCGGAEFGPHGTFAVLSSLADSVSAYIGAGSFTGNSYELDAYDINRHLVAASTVTGTSVGAENPLQVSTTSGEIAYVSIYQTNPMVDDNSAGAQLDDLTFHVPTSTQGYVALTLLNGPSAISAGTSGTFTLGVQRFNGANGPVTIAVSGLPSGVTASLSSNPVSLPDTTSTLTLSAATGTVYQTFQLSATASAAGDVSGPALTDTLGIVAPFSLYVGQSSGLPSSTVLPVMPCSTATTPVRVLTGPGFADPLALSLTATGAGAGDIQAALSRTQIQPSDYQPGSEADQTLTAGRGELTPIPDVVVQLAATSSGFTPATATVFVHSAPSEVGGVTPTLSTQTPQALRPGTEVTITGQGFCPDSTVQFGNAQATGVPESVTGTTIHVRVPRLATSGPVSVSTGSPPLLSAPSSQSVTVDSYRNTNAWAFRNYIPSGFDLGEFSDLFGVGQVYFTINPCWPFSCDIPLFPTPTAGIMLAVADGVLANGSSGGACMGFSLGSQRILESLVPFTDFNASGNTVHSIDGPAGPSAFTTRFINTQALANFSRQFLTHYLGTVLGADVSSTTQTVDNIRSEVQGVLHTGRYPLIALHDRNGGGHLVVAYDVEDVGPHEFYIDVYDSNAPFGWDGSTTSPAEELTASGQMHQTNVSNSRIHVMPDGTWSLPSTGFSGGPDGIVVTDPASIPVHPSMPTALPGSAVYFGSAGPVGPGSASAPPAPSRTTQLTGAGGRTMYATGGGLNTNPSTRLDAAPFAPVTGARTARPEMFVLGSRATDFRQSVVGTGSGAESYTLLASRLVAQIGTRAARGVHDHLTLQPSKNTIGLRTGAAHAPLTLTLTGASVGGAWHTAAVATTSFRGAGDTLAFNASRTALTFVHHGPATTFTLRLSTLQRNGGPASFAGGPLRVGAGQSVQVTGVRWSGLAGARLRVRIGRRVLTMTNRLRAPHLARIARLSVRAASRGRVTLTIRARLARLPRGGVAALVWLVRRGGHVVAAHTVRLLSARTTVTRGWTFAPRGAGRYQLTGRVMVIVPSQGAGVTSSVATATTSFHRR